MDSFKKLLDLMAEVVVRSTAPLISRIDALEKRAPERGEKGEPGTKGLDGEKGQAGERGESGAAGKDGRDGVDGKDGSHGRDGVPGTRGDDGAAGKDGAAGRDGIDGKNGLDGARGTDGKDGLLGERGADGKDGLHGKDGAPGRDGIDGKDGRAGVDGKSIDVDAVIKEVDLKFDAKFAQLEVSVERRVYEMAADMASKAIAAMPRAKDGVDGVRVEDFELVGRMLTLKHGDKVLKQVRLAFPVYHGVYEPELTYDADDMVTFGGSVWVAGAETKSKPGTEGSPWKLAVKKGRDGRDARTPA